MSRGWLIVFAKAPRAGLVKTRLSPPYSLEQCADLYREMLGDVLAASVGFAERLSLEPVVAFHPPEAPNELIGLAPPGFRLQAQRGSNLGARMAYAAREAAAAGAERILIRGSDSPGMPIEVLQEALTFLDRGSDVSLTPDQGGGYAAIGLKAADDRIFDTPMSTESVLAQTLARAEEIGWRAETTEPVFDIDIVGDLQRIELIPAQEQSDLCPRTVEYLSTSPPSRVL